MNLTKADWAEIYYALCYKKTSPAVVINRKWTAHLDAIIEKLGPDGSRAVEAGRKDSTA